MAKGFDGFVILADMRTGSNALEERLNDYDGIVSHGEVFNPHFIGKPGVDELFGITRAARDADPEAMVRTLRERSGGIAGFRLFSDHDPRVLNLCLDDRSTAKVILTRNPLDSYISLKIARETGQWWLADARSRKSARVTFDADEFEAYLAERAAHLASIRHRLQVTGQTAFCLDHAELGDEAVIRGCARFLGAHRLRESASRKGRIQNPVSLAEKVTNPEELEAALAARGRIDPELIPNFEPPRGPNVPSFIASRSRPLLYMPVKCAADAETVRWLAALGGGEDTLERGFTQKALRAWKRKTGAHRSFTVVAHPVARAHAAFCRFILPRGDGAFTGIRSVLTRSYGVALPEDPEDPGYDGGAHRTAFLGFLKFLKANLAGQTAVRIDSAWASQSACVQGLAGFALPDAICRAETLARDLGDLAERVGAASAPEPEPDPATPFALEDIYDAMIERAVRSAYQRDYMMFGYGSWAEG